MIPHRFLLVRIFAAHVFLWWYLLDSIGMYNVNTTRCYSVKPANLKYCGRAQYCLYYSVSGLSCCGNCSLGSVEKCLQANLTRDEL